MASQPESAQKFNQEDPFTPAEREVMDLLIQAHNKFIGLPATHQTEGVEWQDGIHRLQNVLSWRILRREHPKFFTQI